MDSATTIMNDNSKDTSQTNISGAEVCKEKIYLQRYFEIHIVPQDPDGQKITPITLKRDDSLGSEEDQAEQKSSIFGKSEDAYFDLLKQAAAMKRQMVEKYKEKNYSVHVISKKFKN